MQFNDISHGFNLRGASRGPSAIAELLVQDYRKIVFGQIRLLGKPEPERVFTNRGQKD